MQIEMRPIGTIKPYENNPRKNEAAVMPVMESLRRFGFRQPIVVDGAGIIVCGHTRFQAAQRMGMTEVPVHVATDLTTEQINAYRIADNKTAEMAEWDMERLPFEMAKLRNAGVDWSLLGFRDSDLVKMLDSDEKSGMTDPDDIPGEPDEAITQPGDLWILGDHRLLCGDSSSATDLDSLLHGQPVHLVNTDPPYNVKVEPRSNNAIAAGLSSFTVSDARRDGRLLNHHGFDVATGGQSGKATHKKLRPKDRPLANDFVSDEDFDRMLHAWFGNIARVLLPGRAAYIWGGCANIANYPPVLKACGLYFSQTIIWVKEHPVLTRKDFMGNYEWFFYTWREGGPHVFYGPNNVSDVWSIKKVNPQSMIHLTEKPVNLAVRAMKYSSRPGENVLDLFGGSGSTLIAAEQMDRHAFLMELDTLYCDVIVQRWEKFAGRKAELIRQEDPPASEDAPASVVTAEASSVETKSEVSAQPPVVQPG